MCLCTVGWSADKVAIHRHSGLTPEETSIRSYHRGPPQLTFLSCLCSLRDKVSTDNEQKEFLKLENVVEP